MSAEALQRAIHAEHCYVRAAKIKADAEEVLREVYGSLTEKELRQYAAARDAIRAEVILGEDFDQAYQRFLFEHAVAEGQQACRDASQAT